MCGFAVFFGGFRQTGLQVSHMLVYVFIFLFRFVSRKMKLGGGYVPALCLFENLNFFFLLDLRYGF